MGAGFFPEYFTVSLHDLVILQKSVARSCDCQSTLLLEVGEFSRSFLPLWSQENISVRLLGNFEFPIYRIISGSLSAIM